MKRLPAALLTSAADEEPIATVEPTVGSTTAAEAVGAAVVSASETATDPVGLAPVDTTIAALEDPSTVAIVASEVVSTTAALDEGIAPLVESTAALVESTSACELEAIDGETVVREGDADNGSKLGLVRLTDSAHVNEGSSHGSEHI